MNEFIYTNNGLITKFMELMAAVTGLILFSKYKETNVRYFVYFLCYVFILELIGGYTVYVHKYEALSEIKEILKDTWLRRNNWFYTILWVVGSAFFYSFYFRKLLNSMKSKLVLKLLTYCFLLFAIFEIANNWEAFFVTWLPKISLFSTIIITLSILFYLTELLKSDNILKFYKSMNIYISLSVLLWVVITTPLAFYRMYFNQLDWGFVYLKTNVFFFANVFLYTTFTIGLIVSKPEINTSNKN